MKILERAKVCLIFVIFQLSENIVIIQTNQLKDKTSFVAIEKFVALNPKIYSFSDNNSEYEKEKGANKMLQQE